MSRTPYRKPASRLDSDLLDAELATLAIRAGHQRSAEGEHSEPIYPTSSFVFNSAAQAAARFGGDEPGNIYSRFTNPTVRIFEERIAAMEGVSVPLLLHRVWLRFLVCVSACWSRAIISSVPTVSSVRPCH
jgi:hypothetical protein